MGKEIRMDAGYILYSIRFMSKKNISKGTNAVVGRLSTALGADVRQCVS